MASPGASDANSAQPRRLHRLTPGAPTTAHPCEGCGPFVVASCCEVMDEAQRAEVVDAWWRDDLSDEDRDELLALQRGDPVPNGFVDQLAVLHVGGFLDWAFEGQPHMGFQNPAWFSEFLDLKRRARG
jgi:hypothetical protein